MDFIGSVHDGVAGLDHEGHCGWEIGDIAAEIVGWLGATPPTTVLLHLGTNDLYREVDIPNAPARLGALLDSILGIVPEVTVLVATLAAVGTEPLQRRVDAFNAELPRLVRERVRAGHDVRLVDIAARLTAADVVDRLHPNDQGYKKIAHVWFEALTAVSG